MEHPGHTLNRLQAHLRQHQQHHTAPAKIATLKAQIAMVSAKYVQQGVEVAMHDETKVGESATKKRPVSNAEFARTDTIFRDCCKEANVEVTRRQASKFRRKHGKAYAHFRRTAQAHSH